MIALIPARAGSQRIPGKNTKLLGGVPLLEWTIQAARASGVFTDLIVSTDDLWAGWLAQQVGVTYLPRDAAHATATAPDVWWVRAVLAAMPEQRAFCILRPTSPFRSAETIRRAYRQWKRESDCLDSIRAVRPVTETPYKMWTQGQPGMPMTPLLPGAHPDGTPYHSSPTQTLPPVYVQTGGLEMGWTRNVECLGTISGRKVAPFLCDGLEGVDLNTPDDWTRAEALLAAGRVEPPSRAVARVSPAPQTV